MKKNILFYLFTAFLLLYATGEASAEGSGNWTDGQIGRQSDLLVAANSGTSNSGWGNRGFMLLPTTITGTGSATYNNAYDPHHRFYVYVKAGETVHYGFAVSGGTRSRSFRWYYDSTADAADPSKSMDERLYPTAGATVGGTGTRTAMGNAFSPISLNQTQAERGPNGVAGVSNGYNSGSFTNNTSADRVFWLETAHSTSGNNFNFQVTHWDVTVVSGGVKQPGRLYSKYWAVYNGLPNTSATATTASINNATHDKFGFYVPVDNTFSSQKDDYYIKYANFGKANTGYGVFFANSTGPTAKNIDGSLIQDNPNGTPDIEGNRKSIKGKTLSGYQYPLFVSEPDPTIWKTADAPNTTISTSFTRNATSTGGEGFFIVTVDIPGFIDIMIDLDENEGLVDLRIFRYFGSPGTYTIKWDGKDGAGNYVPNGTKIKMSSVASFFPVHFPVYDMEQSLGMYMITVRPAGAPERLFWDHSNIYTGVPGGGGANSATGSGAAALAVDPTPVPAQWNWKLVGNLTAHYNEAGTTNYTFNRNNVQSPAVEALGVVASSDNPANKWWASGDNGVGQNTTMNAYSGSYIDIIEEEFDFNWDSSDVLVEKSVSNANPVLGDEVVFTIKVTNLGLNFAKSVEVLDKLPEGFQYLSHIAPMGAEVTQVDLSNAPPETWRSKMTTYDPVSGIWAVGDIPYDGVLTERNTRTLYITAVLVNSAETDAFKNTASATFENWLIDDPDHTNNTSTVTVPPGNTTFAVNDIEVTFKGVDVSGNVFINDFDYQGDPQNITSITDGDTTDASVITNASGTLTIYPNGDYTFEPAAGFVGTTTFTYTLTDDPASNPVPNNRNPVSATATLTIKVIDTPAAGINNKVVANNDVNITATGVPISGDVLHNDFDAEGNPMTVTRVKDKDGVWHDVVPTGTDILTPDGKVTVYPDGSYIYTSTTPGFVGEDMFDYEVCDQHPTLLPATTCDQAKVTITVMSNSKPNVTFAADDVYTVAKGTGVLKTDNILTNDFDPENNTQRVTSVKTGVGVGGGVTEVSPTGVTTFTTANGGIVKIEADGSFTYENPTDFTGVDVFVYNVCDDGEPEACSSAVVSFEVIGSGSGKIAALDDYSTTRKNVPVSGNALLNDFVVETNSNVGLTVDTDGSPSKTIVQVGVGELLIYPNGDYTFTPATGYVGEAVFTYKIKDADGREADAAIFIDVKDQFGNDNETFATDDMFMTNRNESLTGKNVLDNDTDPDGHTQTVTHVESWNSVSNSWEKIAVVSGGTTFNTKNGSGTIYPNGNVVYTPASGFVGIDNFKYYIADNGSPSATSSAFVSINVMDSRKVIASDDLKSMRQDDPYVSGEVLSNDSDNEGRPLKVTTVTGSSGTPVNVDAGGTTITTTQGGSVTIFPDGTYTYTPPSPGFTGNDTFDYRVEAEGSTDFDNATVTIVVNSVPVVNVTYAKSDVYYTGMGTTLVVDDAGAGILANDRDPKDVPQRVFGLKEIGGTTYTEIPDGGSAEFITPAGGKMTVHSDGTFTYIPAPGFSGTDLFEYQVVNENGATDNETIRIVVGPTSITPQAKDDINQTPRGISVNGNVLTNDDESLTTVTAATVMLGGTQINIVPGTPTVLPGVGTIVIQPDGNYTFTPDPDFVGTVPTITYTASDGGAYNAQANLYITVVDNIVPGNNPPIANHDTGTGKSGTTIIVNPLGNDSDPDGDIISVTEIRAITTSGGTTPTAISTDSGSPSDIYIGTTKVGEAYMDADGKLVFISTAGYKVDVPFEYTITDDHPTDPKTASSTINISVTTTNTPAIVANDDANSVKKGKAGTPTPSMNGNVLDNDEWDTTTSDPTVSAAMYYNDEGILTTLPIDVETPIYHFNGTTWIQAGTIKLSDDGEYVFVPEDNFIGTAQVIYTASKDGVTDNATLSLTVIPLAKAVKVWVGEDTLTPEENVNWNRPTNWYPVGVPEPGDHVEFATDENNPDGPAKNDLHVPIVEDDDGNVINVIITNLTNESDKALVVPPTAVIVVTGDITGSETKEKAGKILIDADETNPNGSFIATDMCEDDLGNPKTSVYGTVKLFAQGQKVETDGWMDDIDGSPTFGQTLRSPNSWQHFGVPAEGVVAVDAFEKSWIQEYNEAQNGKIDGWGDTPMTFYDKWNYVKPYDVLEMFKGYEITQEAPTKYTIEGKLYFCDKELTLTREAIAVDGASGTNEHYGLGQNVFGNSYTAAINVVGGIQFNSDEIDQTVYLYRTGSFQDWGNASMQDEDNIEANAGSYISIPVQVSPEVWGSQIPSMQGFLLKFRPEPEYTKYLGSQETVTLKYKDGGVVGNKRPQLAPEVPKSYLTATLQSESTVDKVWLFSQEGTSDKFDNGWDGFKYFGTPTAYLFSESIDGPMQVNTSSDLDGKVLTLLPNEDTHYTLTLSKSNLEAYRYLTLVDLIARKAIPLTGDKTVYNFTAHHEGKQVKRFILVNSLDIDFDSFSLLDGYLKGNNELVMNNLTTKRGNAYLFDMSGKMILNTVLQTGVNHRSVKLASGAYILRLEADNQRESIKLIVK